MNIKVASEIYREPKGLKIRQSKIWEIFIRYIYYPFYKFLWEYIFNFKGKILYLFSDLRKSSKNKFIFDGLKLVSNDSSFNSIATLVRNSIDDSILNEEKKKLLERNDEESYTTSLTDYLDAKTKAEILKFSLSDNVLTHVFSHMKIVPKLTSMSILYNIPKKGLEEEGSKLWHRDSDLYKSLNIFICLSDVDSTSGAYSAVDGTLIPIFSAIPKKYSILNSVWKRYRLTDQEFYTFAPKSRIITLEGKIGTGAFVDPALCYHKGGFCKINDRIMLQITFSTDDRVSGFDSFLKQYNIDYNLVSNVLNSRVKRFIISPSKWIFLRKIGFTKFLYYLNSNIFICYKRNN